MCDTKDSSASSESKNETILDSWDLGLGLDFMDLGLGFGLVNKILLTSHVR